MKYEFLSRDLVQKVRLVAKLCGWHSSTFSSSWSISAFVSESLLFFSLLELENCLEDFERPLMFICFISSLKICWIPGHSWSLKCPPNHYYSSLLIIYRTRPYWLYYSFSCFYWFCSRNSTPSWENYSIWSALIFPPPLSHFSYLNCSYFSFHQESFEIVSLCFDILKCEYLVVQIEYVEWSGIFGFLLIVGVCVLLPYCFRLLIIELCFWNRRRVMFGTFGFPGCSDFLLLSCLICVFLVFDLDFAGMIWFFAFCLVCLIFSSSENGRICSLFLICIVDRAGSNKFRLLLPYSLHCLYGRLHFPMFLSIPLRSYANRPRLFEVAIIQKFLISSFLDSYHSVD